jgi:hypothetical protein
MFFAGILEHQASQERPKTAKKASKTVPRSLPDLSKTCSILGSRFFDFRIPFWGPKRSPEEPKTKPKSGSKILPFFDHFWTKKGLQKQGIRGTLFEGFSSRNDVKILRILYVFIHSVDIPSLSVFIKNVFGNLINPTNPIFFHTFWV